MFNKIVNLSILIFSIFIVLYAYTDIKGLWQLGFMFLGGVMFGIFLMNIKLNINEKALYSYKMQLEKESVSSDESSAKVKILESKINVLEKALESALNENK